MVINRYKVAVGYDLGERGPSDWRPEGHHLETAKEIPLESRTGATATITYVDRNRIRFDGPWSMSYQRKGTQEETQLAYGLLFVVAFFLLAFYLSKN